MSVGDFSSSSAEGGRKTISKKYFLQFLPSTKNYEKATKQNSRCKRVKGYLKKEKVILNQLAHL